MGAWQMSKCYRFLALYGWSEVLGLAWHPSILAELSNNLCVVSNKITYFIPSERKARHKTILKSGNLIGVISKISQFDRISLDQIPGNNLLDVNGQVNIDDKRKRYVAAKEFEEFGVEHCIGHARPICQFITPLYEFSHVGLGVGALFFPHGQASTDYEQDVRTRIHDLGDSLRRTNEHLQGKIHDVYELNVLSSLHLDREIQGIPLKRWIEQEGWGKLSPIKENVFIWTVPDNIRGTIRELLLKQNALIVSV
jgi:hypothetical protein